MATYNSSQYAWADLSIAYAGRIIEGITEVEYTEKKDKEPLYGRGSKPHQIVTGNYSYEGKIMIWQSELEAMTRDAPDKDILRLQFDIVNTYLPRDGEGQIVNDLLKCVQITEVKKGMKQGDKNMLIELPIIFLDVERQQ